MPAPPSTLHKALKKVRRRTFLATKRMLQKTRSSGSPGDKQVHFVAGVQRSGTNMMMNVLEQHLDTDVYHETDPRAFDHYEMRPPNEIRALVAASPARHVVIKALCELQSLSSLLDRFMPAKAAWIIRNVDDVVNSHLRLWTGMPESIRRIVEETETAGWRGRGLSPDTLETLRRHYHPGLSNASACALFWYLRNVLYFEQQLDTDPRVILVRYEDLVTEPHSKFHEIFSFFGLDYTPRIGRRVFASSVRKSTPPEIEAPVRRLCEDLDDRLKSCIQLKRDSVTAG